MKFLAQVWRDTAEILGKESVDASEAREEWKAALAAWKRGREGRDGDGSLGGEGKTG